MLIFKMGVWNQERKKCIIYSSKLITVTMLHERRFANKAMISYFLKKKKKKKKKKKHGTFL